MKGNTNASIDMPGNEYRKDFPTFNGYIVGLEYVPKGSKRDGYENLIRDWCRKNPDRKLWPVLVSEWAEVKKRLEAAGK
jgi:hypothetical protein